MFLGPLEGILSPECISAAFLRRQDRRIFSLKWESFLSPKSVFFVLWRISVRCTKISNSNVPYRHSSVIWCPEHISNIIATFYPLFDFIIALCNHVKPQNGIYFSPLCTYNEKWPKNVIFHDFFKLFLDVLRWSCRYVEVFLRPLEGILNPRMHFCLILKPQQTRMFQTKTGL